MITLVFRLAQASIWCGDPELQKEGHKQYCVAANRRGFPIRESYRTICILLSEFRSKLPCYNLCWPPWAWSKPSVLISAADAHTYAALQGAWRWWAGPQPCLVRPRAAHGGLSSVPSRAVEVVPNLALSITHSLTHSLEYRSHPLQCSRRRGSLHDPRGCCVKVRHGHEKMADSYF